MATVGPRTGSAAASPENAANGGSVAALATRGPRVGPERTTPATAKGAGAGAVGEGTKRAAAAEGVTASASARDSETAAAGLTDKPRVDADADADSGAGAGAGAAGRVPGEMQGGDVDAPQVEKTSGAGENTDGGADNLSATIRVNQSNHSNKPSYS